MVCAYLAILFSGSGVSSITIGAGKSTLSSVGTQEMCYGRSCSGEWKGQWGKRIAEITDCGGNAVYTMRAACEGVVLTEEQKSRSDYVTNTFVVEERVFGSTFPCLKRVPHSHYFFHVINYYIDSCCLPGGARDSPPS